VTVEASHCVALRLRASLFYHLEQTTLIELCRHYQVKLAVDPRQRPQLISVCFGIILFQKRWLPGTSQWARRRLCFHAKTKTGIGTALQDLHVKVLSSVPRLVTYPPSLDNVIASRTTGRGAPQPSYGFTTHPNPTPNTLRQSLVLCPRVTSQSNPGIAASNLELAGVLYYSSFQISLARSVLSQEICSIFRRTMPAMLQMRRARRRACLLYAIPTRS